MKKFISLFLTVIMLVSVIGFMPVYASGTVTDTILFEEDFDDYDVKAYTISELTQKNEKAGIGASWTSDYEIKQTSSGKKYLSITAPDKDTGGGYYVPLDPLVTEGNLVAEMKLLPSAEIKPAHPRTYLNVFGVDPNNSANTSASWRYYGLGSNYGNNLYSAISNGAIAGSGSAVKNMPVPDGDGFWNLRLVLSREATTDNWGMTIYDATNNKVIITNPNIEETAGGYLKDIYARRVYFVDMWGDANSGNHVSNITDLKVYKPRAVTFEEATAYDRTAGTVSFTVSENLDATSLVQGGAVTVSGPDGEHSATAVLNNSVLTITMANKLLVSGNYTVSFNGVKTSRQTMVYETAYFTADIPNEDEILFEEDFDDYELREYTKAELKQKQPDTVFGDTWTQKYEVKQTQSGKKYLSIAAPAKDMGGGYKVDHELFAYGNLVAEMKVLPQANPNDKAHAWNYFLVGGKLPNTETKYNYYTIATNLGTNIYTLGHANGVFGTTNGAPLNNPVPDNDGFWNFRLVFNRENEDKNWSLTIYDATNNNVIVSKNNIDNLSKINAYRMNFVDMWGVVTDVSGQHANITDLKIYKPQKVIFTQNGGYDAENNTISFTVSEPLDTASLASGTVTISSPSSGPEETTATYSNGLLTVSVPETLGDSESYTVDFDGVKTLRQTMVYETAQFTNVSKDYEIEGLTFKVDGVEVHTMPESGSSISAVGTITHSSETTQNGIVFLAVYDVYDNLMGWDKQDISVSKAQPFSLDLSVENLSINSGYKAKLIFIESLTTVKPLRVAEVLAASQF